ncbi:hypothetical protein D3C85_913680 [compost metagenome]
MNVVNTGQQTIDRFAHVWVEVHRVHDFYIRKGCGGFGQRLANPLEPPPKTLAPMSCHKDYSLTFREEVELFTELQLQTLSRI